MADGQRESYYFSGQGVLFLASRDGNGDSEGFTPVGNVSALSIAVETSEFEHKESQSGVRAIDLTLAQEINASATMTMESLDKENLALALYGTSNSIVAGSATDESVVGFHDKWSALANIQVSSVVVTDNTDTTTYTEGTDYEVNLVAGTIKVLSTGTITDTEELHVDYSYAAQDNVEAMTSGSAPERWARFEGLNTADGDKPVVVDAFKMSIQPLAELALIQEEIAQLEVESKILSDATKATGSKFFRIRYQTA